MNPPDPSPLPRPTEEPTAHEAGSFDAAMGAITPGDDDTGAAATDAGFTYFEAAPPVGVGRDKAKAPGRKGEGADPWAHRRGEPRLFAFFWTFYVLLSVAGSLTWLARTGVVSVGSYGPAARIMLVVVAVGMVLLWPMTRLSQASPLGNSVWATLADLLVVQMPVQIVTWPLRVLANWPLDIVAGVSALLAAWGVLTGGVLALALGGRPLERARDPRLTGRMIWMAGMLGLILAAPVAQGVVFATGRTPPGWMSMASPITAIPVLTGRGLIGPAAPVSRIQWDTIVVTLSVGVLLWSLGVARNGLSRGGRTDEPDTMSL